VDDCDQWARVPILAAKNRGIAVTEQEYVDPKSRYGFEWIESLDEAEVDLVEQREGLVKEAFAANGAA
jgi:hypothetical protein